MNNLKYTCVDCGEYANILPGHLTRKVLYCPFCGSTGIKQAEGIKKRASQEELDKAAREGYYGSSDS